MLGRLANRSNKPRRAPQWLALLAMLIQFVASYGHFDPQDFNFLKHGHGSLSLVASHSSAGGFNGVTGDTDCPICASMQILGSSALPEGVRLPLPPLHGSSFIAALVPLNLPAPHYFLPDTRGSPLT